MHATFWNDRFGLEDYSDCGAPNGFLPVVVSHISVGPVLMILAGLREELAALELMLARELEREVIQGVGHTGRGAVVQVLARRRG